MPKLTAAMTIGARQCTGAAGVPVTAQQAEDIIIIKDLYGLYNDRTGAVWPEVLDVIVDLGVSALTAEALVRIAQQQMKIEQRGSR